MLLFGDRCRLSHFVGFGDAGAVLNGFEVADHEIQKPMKFRLACRLWTRRPRQQGIHALLGRRPKCLQVQSAALWFGVGRAAEHLQAAG